MACATEKVCIYYYSSLQKVSEAALRQLANRHKAKSGLNHAMIRAGLVLVSLLSNQYKLPATGVQDVVEVVGRRMRRKCRT